ncbi:MAG TPA: lysophospholipid acyltransferase family protein [Vicinamibacteria bacterium]
MRTLLRRVVEALFRVLFTYDCLGEAHVPAGGPAVVAANHPSYLDPLLLSLQVERPIRFMAWDALFKVPLLGTLLRAFGAFPVDVRRGQGRAAYEKAKALVLAGEVVGIFPEGKRSRTGWMESTLRQGAARLAWETGAPLVPATISGAFRAWPYHQALPRPGRIRVRFHEPIDPAPLRGLAEDEALPRLLEELRRRVERSLLPGVKADLRTTVIYRLPAPRPRAHELAAALLAGGAVAWQTRSAWAVLPACLYLAYLFLDRPLIPPSRLAKWARNASALLFVLGYGPVVATALRLEAPSAGAALAAVLLGASFAYLYERGGTVLGLMRGFVLAAALELLAQKLAPTPLGAHLALPVFAAAYAWQGRTVFWRYAVPVLLGYAAAVALMFRGGLELLPHVLAGLVAWLGGWLILYDRPARADPEAPLGLGLRL